jgi:hypothetical protein
MRSVDFCAAAQELVHGWAPAFAGEQLRFPADSF